MLELIQSLGFVGIVIGIISAVLLFFLPFYVAGIYHRIIKCQEQLEKLNRSIDGFKKKPGKSNNLNSKIAERAKDPNSIFHKDQDYGV